LVKAYQNIISLRYFDKQVSLKRRKAYDTRREEQDSGNTKVVFRHTCWNYNDEARETRDMDSGGVAIKADVYGATSR